MATLNINERIGDYWVKTLIKSNAYTETYRVEDSDSHPYFLKLFLMNNLPSQLLDDESKEVKEIGYSSHLSQRNIVSFINKGSVRREEGDLQYYVTNYFKGVVLTDYVNRNGRLQEERAEKIFREILAGLKYLHSQMPVLLHNDIDPSNIMLSETNEEAIIIDMGHVSERCTGLVHFDTSDLDIFYRANETASGIYDEQTDIFSACGVLYYMLAAHDPWQTDIEGCTFKERLKALWQYRKNNKLDIDSLTCSQKLKEVLKHGLALKQSDRYDTIDNIISSLDNIQSESDVNAKSSQISHSNASADEVVKQSPNYVEFHIRKGNGKGFQDIAGMAALKDTFIPVQRVPVERINRITKKNHQGVIAFISPITYQRTEDIVPFLFEQGKNPLLIMLDGLTDVRNFGAIARTCECAGVDAIIIPNKNSVSVNADAIKTSAGALHTLPVCREANLRNTIKYLKDSGFKIIAATEKGDYDYTKADYEGPTCIIMGAEDTGVSYDNLALCDEWVKIPMLGTIESLNVSVAAGVLIYEAIKQRGFGNEK